MDSIIYITDGEDTLVQRWRNRNTKLPIGWHFCDELGAIWLGPYNTLEATKHDLQAYIRDLQKYEQSNKQLDYIYEIQ